jgi:biotin carboxyl carrier protein
MITSALVCECEATCLPAATKPFITGVARLGGGCRRDGLVGWASNLSGRIGKGEETMAEEIRAPLAGTVLSVLVEPNAKVDVDDELLVIEAMKMENLVYAPCAGAVATIKVNAGEKVEAGDLLLVIE